MSHPIPHLVDGALLAFKEGPKYRHSNESEHIKYQNEWYAKLKEVYLHYENGGTVFNRP